MTPQHHEVIVLGLGAMGSAAMYELSHSKVQCLGIEQFTPAHDLGSSHGQTRAIRKAYYEHPDYVPLLLDAYNLWEKLEKKSHTELLVKTGLIHATDLDHEIYQGSRLSAQKHYLSFEEYNIIDLQVKYPSMRFDDNHNALFEPDGGYLWVERAIETFQQNVHTKYAQMRFEERVLEIQPEADKLILITNKGMYTCDQLVLASGPWARSFLPDMPVQACRTTYHFFEHPAAKDMPVFFFNTKEDNWLYGFPPIDGRMKVAYHHAGDPCDAKTVRRTVEPSEIKRIEKEARGYVPKLGKHISSHVCMYTMSPDGHFILGRCPDNDRIVVASGFSGHGFKFAPVVGQAIRDLVSNKDSIHNIDFFSPSRFEKTC